MKKNRIIGWIIGILLITAAACAVLFFMQKNREAALTRETEIAAATLTAMPTETPIPTATPTDTPEPTPVPTDTPEPTAIPALDPKDWKNWPELPEIVSPELKALYFEGIAEGNSAERFSKVGDSNTITGLYFGCFDYGAGLGYDLGPYAYLQEAIDQFQWSFSRITRAARNGARAYDMDTYHWYDDDVCWPYESALNCEFRLYIPSIAFIGFGTNDAVQDIQIYRDHLSSLVEKTLARKIVPVLFTKADDLEGDGSFNEATAEIAAEYHVPLWNLWQAMSRLPNNGLQEKDVHPTANDAGSCNFSGDDMDHYGWTARNLSALKALDRVWRLLNDLPIYGE